MRLDDPTSQPASPSDDERSDKARPAGAAAGPEAGSPNASGSADAPTTDNATGVPQDESEEPRAGSSDHAMPSEETTVPEDLVALEYDEEDGPRDEDEDAAERQAGTPPGSDEGAGAEARGRTVRSTEPGESSPGGVRGRGETGAEGSAPAAGPRIEVDPALPIWHKREEIERALRGNQVVILAGETGSGKTTQLPKICLQAGLGTRGRIAVTQPRRVAAISLARRLAEETGTKPGSLVGYRVRHDDMASRDTRVVFVTDGLLLAELVADPLLRRYDCIVVDEAHERTLNIDFLLGILRQLLPRRPDLKVAVASATLDIERFAKAFETTLGKPVPVIQVEGRGFPVEVLYQDELLPEAEESDDPLAVRAAACCREMMDAEKNGDLLCFLPGEREIHDTARELEESARRGRYDVHKLFGRMSSGDQAAIFDPGPRRRVILATNVAETSITVPRIRMVVDMGLVRLSRYAPRTRTKRLLIEEASRASARQRAGRCGRVGPGICLRAYTREDFEAREDFTPPEILRSDLSEVILRMLALHLGDPREFPFLTPPDERAVADGWQLLRELGAIDDDKRLTETGRRMARLPLDPRSSRILLESREQGALHEGIIVTAGLAVPDPRERPEGEEEKARAAQKRFEDPQSDFLTLVNIYEDFIGEVGAKPSANAIRKYCKRHYLSFPRMREWRDSVLQIEGLLREARLGALPDTRRAPASDADAPPSGRPGDRPAAHAPRERSIESSARSARSQEIRGTMRGAEAERRPGDEARPSGPASGPAAGDKGGDRAREPRPPEAPSTSADYGCIHRALLSGFLSNVCQLDAEATAESQKGGKRRAQAVYRAARGRQVNVFPGSVLSGRQPPWIVAAEIVETSRVWARSAAEIDPVWVEAVAGDLVRYVYGEPHFDDKRRQVLVPETVLLWGLPIVRGRLRSCVRVDPAGATECFVREALLEERLSPAPAFIEANRKARETISRWEERLRRNVLYAGDEALFRWYRERLPDGIGSMQDLDKWLKANGGPQTLAVPLTELLSHGSEPPSPADFPDTWSAGDLEFPLEYRFCPGEPEIDGLTILVPLESLERLSQAALEWMVPGNLADRIEALVRALPRQVRTELAPLRDTIGRAAKGLAKRFGHAPQRESLAEWLRSQGARVHPGSFTAEEDMPSHLRMRIVVLGRNGKAVAASRDLAALKAEIAPLLREETSGPAWQEAFSRREPAQPLWTDWPAGTALLEEKVIPHPRGGMPLRAWSALESVAGPASLSPVPPGSPESVRTPPPPSGAMAQASPSSSPAAAPPPSAPAKATPTTAHAASGQTGTTPVSRPASPPTGLPPKSPSIAPPRASAPPSAGLSALASAFEKAGLTVQPPRAESSAGSRPSGKQETARDSSEVKPRQASPSGPPARPTAPPAAASPPAPPAGVVRQAWFPSIEEAERTHRTAVQRLLGAVLDREEGRALAWLERDLALPQDALLALMAFAPAREFERRLAQCARSWVLESALSKALPRTRAEFAVLVEEGRSRLRQARGKGAALAREIASARRDFEEAARQVPANDPLRVVADRTRERLWPSDYPAGAAWSSLAYAPRWWKAAARRLRTALENRPRDAARAEQLAPFLRRLRDAAGGEPPPRLPSEIHAPSNAERMQELSFLLEEFRVQIWAQELGATIPVSAVRLSNAFREAGLGEVAPG